MSEVLEISAFDDDDNIQDDFPCDLLGRVFRKLEGHLIYHWNISAASPLTEYREWKRKMVQVKG